MKDQELSKNENAILEKLSSLTSKKYKYVECFDNDDYRLYHRNDLLYFSIEGKKILELEVEMDSKNSVQECLDNLSSLKLLTIYIKNTKEKISYINLHLESLKYLNLYTEGTVKIKTSFENLPNLLRLEIKGDDIGSKEFLNPDSIKNAKNLESLEIVSIPIIKIPKSIIYLKNLKDLILRNCDIKRFDNFILDLEKLEWLDFRGNRDLKIKKNLRNILYKKLSLFNPPEHYLDEDLCSFF